MTTDLILVSLLATLACLPAPSTQSGDVNPEAITVLHILHHGKRLSNNSRILVEDGDPLLLECSINFSATKKSGSPTLLRPKQFVWKTSENETVSYSPKLDLPNVYYPEEKTQEETPSSGGVINYRCGLLYEKKAFKWAHVAVKVTKPPSFTIRREPAFGIPVQEDMTVTLSCDIEIEEELKASLIGSDGNPLSAKWLKNEHPVTSEGTFLIARATATDVGWYQCYVNLKDKTYSSIGYFLNVIPKESSTELPAEELPDSSEVNSTKSVKIGQKLPTSINVQRVGDSVIYEDSVRHVHDNCSCCPGGGSGHKRHSKKHHRYSPPRIRVVNGSSSSESGLGGNSSWMTLTMEVCSNPKPDKMLWITPDSYAVRPGQSIGRYHARVSVSSQGKVTCELANLDIDISHTPSQNNADGGSISAAASQEGKYSLIVRNHHGTSEAETFITSSRPKSASTDTTTAYAHQKKAPAAVSKAAISLPQLTNATQTTTLSVLSYTLVIKFMSSLGIAVPTRARHSIVL